MPRFNPNDYKEVAERILEFWKEHPDWSFIAKIVNCDDNTILMEAEIKDENGTLRANGFAEETRSLLKHIGAHNAVEICETSARGRALAALSYLGSKKLLKVAGREEISNAIALQNELKKKPITDDLKEDVMFLHDLSQKKYPEHYGNMQLEDFWGRLQANAIREGKEIDLEYLKSLQNKLEEK